MDDAPETAANGTENKDKQAKKKRLSSALRENLKRRKAAPRPKKDADAAE